MSAEASVYIAAGFVIAMVLMLIAVAAMVLLDGIAAAPVRPRPRHRRSPGAQYWVRSVETDTASMFVIDTEGRRVA